MTRRPRTVLTAVSALALALFGAAGPAGASDPIAVGESIAVGDSITVGAQQQLRAAGYRVDATVGRTFSQGLRVIRAQGGSLPPRVLVNLGTNGGVAAGQCEELAALVGPTRSLTLVTINLPAYPGLAASSNAALAECAARVGARLLDWAGHSRAHPELLCPDGMHISCGGASGYARFVLAQAAPAPAPAPPAATTSTAPERAAAAAPATSGSASQSQWAAARAAAEAAAAAARQAEVLAAQELAAAEAARAEAARIAAEQQRRLERLQRTGVQDLELVERDSSPATYRFLAVADRLSRGAASS